MLKTGFYNLIAKRILIVCKFKRKLGSFAQRDKIKNKKLSIFVKNEQKRGSIFYKLKVLYFIINSIKIRVKI